MKILESNICESERWYDLLPGSEKYFDNRMKDPDEPYSGKHPKDHLLYKSGYHKYICTQCSAAYYFASIDVDGIYNKNYWFHKGTWFSYEPSCNILSKESK